MTVFNPLPDGHSVLLAGPGRKEEKEQNGQKGGPEGVLRSVLTVLTKKKVLEQF